MQICRCCIRCPTPFLFTTGQVLQTLRPGPPGKHQCTPYRHCNKETPPRTHSTQSTGGEEGPSLQRFPGGRGGFICQNHRPVHLICDFGVSYTSRKVDLKKDYRREGNMQPAIITASDCSYPSSTSFTGPNQKQELLIFSLGFSQTSQPVPEYY